MWIEQLNECSVTSFDYTVLLWSIGSREVVVNSFFCENLFNGGVGELRSIITSNSPDGEFDKDFYSFNEIYEL